MISASNTDEYIYDYFQTFPEYRGNVHVYKKLLRHAIARDYVFAQKMPKGFYYKQNPGVPDSQPTFHLVID